MKNFEQKVQNETEGPIVLKIFLQRHGPKLSASGEKNEVANYFESSVRDGFADMNLGEGKGLAHVTSSPVLRAQKTGEIVEQELSASNRRLGNNVATQKKLKTPFQPESDVLDQKHFRDYEKLVVLQSSLEPSIRAKIMTSHKDASIEKQEALIRNEIDTEILSILFDSQTASAYGLETSYEEMADALAERYRGFLRHMPILSSRKEQSDLQPKEEPYVQIDISHSFPVMSFLKKYLVFDDGVKAIESTPAEFFERVGGVIPESGSLEFDFKKRDAVYDILVKGSYGGGTHFSGRINF